MKTIDDYFKVLDVCESMSRKYRPDHIVYVPTIEDLKEHHVEDHLDFYYPYLVYYGDKECFDGGEAFEPVYQYIQELLKKASEKPENNI